MRTLAAQQGPPQRRMPAQADSLRQRMTPCDMMMRHMSAGMMGRSSDSTRAAMQMMMADPLMRSAMLLRTLPALGDTLGLSAEQAANLQRYRDEYQQKRQETTAAIADKHRELQAAFAAAEPDPDRVRDLLEEAADLRAELMALGYETSVRMHASCAHRRAARAPDSDAANADAAAHGEHEPRADDGDDGRRLHDAERDDGDDAGRHVAGHATANAGAAESARRRSSPLTWFFAAKRATV